MYIFENKKRSNYTKPGAYLAKITAVRDNERYIKGDAFIIEYSLYNERNEFVSNFYETFLNNSNVPRTKELIELMKQLSVDNVDDLVGITIRVKILYRATDYGYGLPSIVSREPLSVSEPSEEVSER